jgi:uncharacterized membrane protein HdeD (DUF308 family)
MTIDRVFIGFMIAVGVAIGIVLILHPEAREFRVTPYFWVLIAMAIFEGVNFARFRGAPGTAIGMPTRLLGFALGIGLMVVIPLLAGYR